MRLLEDDYELHSESCKRCGEVISDYSWYVLGKRMQEHLLNDCTGFDSDSTIQKDLYGRKAKPAPAKGGDNMPTFKEIGSAQDTWGGGNTKKGSVIVGKLVEVSQNANNDDMVDYILETKNGRIRVWGSSILCKRLGTQLDKHPHLGKQIRLTYKGKIKAKRGLAHDYKVEIAE